MRSNTSQNLQNEATAVYLYLYLKLYILSQQNLSMLLIPKGPMYVQNLEQNPAGDIDFTGEVSNCHHPEDKVGLPLLRKRLRCMEDKVGDNFQGFFRFVGGGQSRECL